VRQVVYLQLLFNAINGVLRLGGDGGRRREGRNRVRGKGVRGRREGKKREKEEREIEREGKGEKTMEGREKW
jgi:hypothetical protein